MSFLKKERVVLWVIRATTLAALLAMSTAALAQKMVVAYLPNWNDVKSVLSTVDLSKITHLDVAFENPTNDKGDLSFNPADAVVVAKAHEKKIKVLISIGGGGAAEDKTLIARYFALQANDKRAGFVAKLLDYVKLHDFDGLDVDIEGPSVGKDYGAFISDLADAFRPSGKLLSAAVSQWYGGDQIPNSALQQLSFVNVMAYDATGPWNPQKPGQHSSLDYAKSVVAYWQGRGLAKNKTVLGVPFYGYGFGAAYRSGDYSYAEIVKTYPGAEKLDQIGGTIWYNGIPTIRAKSKFVVDEGLAGVMIWSLDGDAPGEKSLLSALYDQLNSKG